MSANTSACTLCSDLGVLNLGPSGIQLCHAEGCKAKEQVTGRLQIRRLYEQALETATEAANDAVEDINRHDFYASSDMIEAALVAYHKAVGLPFEPPAHPWMSAR